MLGWFGKKDKEKEKDGRPPAPARPQSLGGPGLQGVALSRLLREDLILPAPDGLDKEGLIAHLVRHLCARRSLGEPERYLAKVLEREQGISTTLDTGLAVPHARLDDLPELAAVLALVPRGMRDPKQPDLVIRAMFLFFSPNRREALTQHLLLLRGVSWLFKSSFIDELNRAADGAAALRLISAKEAAQGA